MSTSGTNDSYGLHDSHAHAMALPSCASAQVGVGEFTKPRIGKRNRRDTHGSARSSRSDGEAKDMEFKYYGRHSNQWLFNDFSVTDAVAKGFKRAFGRDRADGDWYENREK